MVATYFLLGDFFPTSIRASHDDQTAFLLDVELDKQNDRHKCRLPNQLEVF